MASNSSGHGGGNVPLYATICAVAFVACAVLLVLFADPHSSQSIMIVLGLIVTTLPSLVASIFAERASRDIRNGVLEEKAKSGAAQAIQEQQVLVRTGPVVSTELAALSRLLEANTAATQTNTNVLQHTEDPNSEGSEPNGRPSV